MRKSESITEIAKALVAFNGEVTKISKDANNPMFRNNYATLDQIIAEIRPLLQKNGLSILQIPSGSNETLHLKTMLIHESGEWMESDEFSLAPMPQIIDKTTKERAITPQSIGSAITYARRYSLSSFLSLNTGEDDDGNNASFSPNVQASKGTLSEAQLKRMYAIGKAAGYDTDKLNGLIWQKYKKYAKQLNREEYDTICKGLEEVTKK